MISTLAPMLVGFAIAATLAIPLLASLVRLRRERDQARGERKAALRLAREWHADAGRSPKAAPRRASPAFSRRAMPSDGAVLRRFPR